MPLFLTAITVNEDESQTHIGWEIEQEVVEILYVMLGEPKMHAIVPADTFQERQKLSQSMILIEDSA